MDKNDILTVRHLLEFEVRLINKIKEITKRNEQQKKWLRTSDLKKLLGLSSSSIQSLRISGILPYSKVNGTLYYDYDEVQALLQEHKVQ